MQILGVEGLSREQVAAEVQRGAKFVIFQYCISILIMTFRRGTDIYYVRPGESTIGRGLPYTLLTFLLGWWGIPWGPIYSVQCLATNLGGGRNVTDEVLRSMGIESYGARRAS
jgi:hypothetical protein